MKMIINNKVFSLWLLIIIILIINNNGIIHATKTCVDGEIQSNNTSCICSYSTNTIYSADGNATTITSPIMCTTGQSCNSGICKTINCKYCSACSSDASTCLLTCPVK